MRLLLTSHPIHSHLVPLLVPLAGAARDLGHEVAVATAASMADELGRHRITHLALPHVAGQAELRGDPALAARYGLPDRLLAPGRRTVEPAVWRQIARAYAGPIALDFARDVIDAARDWKPDVLVREPTEYGGYLAAEALDIPHATLDFVPSAALDLPMVADVLDERAGQLGLRRPRRHPHHFLRAGVLPEEWYPPDAWPGTARYYRAPTPRTEPALDPAVAALPADRPLVLAGLGTLALTLPGMEAVLPTIVAALGALPCEAVLALGGRADLADGLGPVPGNVHVTGFVPQHALLGACDLFLTHAGFNSVHGAVVAGVPMVALPSFSDQPHNARRIAELGLGESLDIDTVTPAGLAAACRRVLDSAAIRRNTRAMQLRILACPDFEQLVADLAALAEAPRA